MATFYRYVGPARRRRNLWHSGLQRCQNLCHSLCTRPSIQLKFLRHTIIRLLPVAYGQEIGA